MLVTKLTNRAKGARPRLARRPPRAEARSRTARLRALARAEDGFTLMEMLVASALGLIVFAAVVSALEVSQHVQARDSEWGIVIQESRSGLARMAREMRQAYSIRSDSHSSIDFYATLGGKSYEIAYNCAERETGTEYNQCVRRAAAFGEKGEAPTGLPAKGEPVVRYVLNGTAAAPTEVVFKEYTPNEIAPDLVTIKVIVPSAGPLKLADAAVYKHHIVLENGAYIREMALGV